MKAKVKASLLLAVFPCFSFCSEACYIANTLLALTKSQGTADILLPGKFTDPAEKDGKGKAGRVSCVWPALGEGCVPVLDSGAVAGASLYAHGTKTKSTANPLLQHLCFVKGDLISDKPQHIHHQEFVSHPWETSPSALTI